MCVPVSSLISAHPQVSQVDAQFLNLALAPKQWISELLGVGQPWAWDPVAMERHWDPSVPFQRLHEPNDTEVWVTGYGDD